MKITRHLAPDMRQALRAVRESLGPDAVILSSRRTLEGVEVVAAMDLEVEALEAQASAAAAPPGIVPPAAAVAPPDPPADRARPAAAAPTSVPPSEPHAEPDVEDAMSQELRTLRRLLERQLAGLAWNDLQRRAPIHTELLRELTEIGFAQELATDAVAQIPAGADLTRARRLAIATVAQRILVTGDRWLDGGGRIAFVGPTGVGKTTALAKLAVRWALRHGARGLALVAADPVRLGAQEQLQSLGQLLGAPVHPLDDLAELPVLLGRLGHHRLVLVDTAGSSQRDSQLGGRLAALAATQGLETALVLAASTQAAAVEETVRRFAPARPSSCLLTKVDEAASLGGLLSTLIRARLPIAYVSEGQRVPEDLRPARALELVSQAVQLAAATGAAADEELLRRRFGEVAHALA